MDWQLVMAELVGMLEHRGIPHCKASGGVTIEFSDGCDALFVAPKFVERHRLVGSSGEIVRAILQRFDELDSSRRQVILGLRHHAKNQKVAIERSSTGEWGLETAGGCSSSIDVGANLTRLVGQMSPAESLRKILENSWLRKVSLQRAERLVSKTEPPSEEIRADEFTEPKLNPSPGLLTLDCSVLDEPNFTPQSGVEFADALTRHRNDPGVAVIQELASGSARIDSRSIFARRRLPNSSSLTSTVRFAY